MRRPDVYQRSAPRAARPRATSSEPSPATATAISRALPSLIAAARAEGLEALADALDVARAEAERAMGRPVGVVEG